MNQPVPPPPPAPSGRPDSRAASPVRPGTTPESDAGNATGRPNLDVDQPDGPFIAQSSTFEPAARALGATKLYGSGDTAVAALQDVSVDFGRGQFTAVMGASGSGKSTLMHCLAGLDTLTAGQVFIGDTDLSQLNDHALTLLRRDRVGFVFQSFNLIPTLSAKENILLPLSLAGNKPDPEWYDQIISALGLEDRLSHRPSELSGGQQQRVAVARALVSRPDLIFADEPTGNLDSTSGGTVLRFLREAVDKMGQTIVMVTHDPLAASWADRAVFLADGHVVDEILAPTADLVLDRMKRLDSLAAASHPVYS